MKTFGRTRRTIYSSASWIYIACTVFAAALSFIADLDESSSGLENRPIAWALIEKLQDYSIWIYLIILTLLIVCLSVQKLGDPWVWEKLKFILDEYQSKAFERNGNDPNDHHRVTLFQHKKGCVFQRHWSSTKFYKPSGKHRLFADYLIPVLRSGHISQKTNAIFHASDSSDEAEGVVGQAWARRSSIVIPDLPEVRTGNPKNRKRYSEATFTDKRMVDSYLDSNRPVPRSIAAIPVEVNGNLWGVVVLDSRVANGVSHDSVQNYELTVSLIGQLLERA